MLPRLNNYPRWKGEYSKQHNQLSTADTAFFALLRAAMQFGASVDDGELARLEQRPRNNGVAIFCYDSSLIDRVQSFLEQDLGLPARESNRESGQTYAVSYDGLEDEGFRRRMGALFTGALDVIGPQNSPGYRLRLHQLEGGPRSWRR